MNLPVAWDGVAVEWGPWNAWSIYTCPPRPQAPCQGCGLIWPRSTARGVRRIQIGIMGPLWAHRCTHCGHDEVYDSHTGQQWELDMTDYGPDGSWSVG